LNPLYIFKKIKKNKLKIPYFIRALSVSLLSPHARAATKDQPDTMHVPLVVLDITSHPAYQHMHAACITFDFLKTYSLRTKECNYEMHAGQTCSSLIKSKVNSIYTYNLK
jgi:hypothetical protein